jgi:hypothetical protein
MFIAIPKKLREKLGEEAAEELVELLNISSGNTRDSVLIFVEEKFERRLAEETAKIREELAEESAKIRGEFSNEFAKIRGELANESAEIRGELSHEISQLRGEMHENKVSTIRWMFLFWVGQIGVLLGFLLAFIR